MSKLCSKATMTIGTKLALGIVSCLGHSWSEKVFCDITVAIDGQEFKCHRFHLNACSEFFKVLLGSNQSLDYLIIKGIRPDIFELILDSIYKGDISINTDNMIDQWYAANQLEIRFLLEEIENFIILNISVDNYLHIFDVAHDLKADRVLAGVCQAFIVNWENFREDQRFLILSCEELQSIIQNANTISSDELVESILLWTNFEVTAPIKSNIKKFPFSKEIDDVNKFVEVTLKSIVNLDISERVIHYENTSINRKKSIGKLLQNVKINLISQQGLNKLLFDDIVMDCKEARDLVRQALASRLESSEVTASVTETLPSNQSQEVATLTASDDDLLPTALFFDGSVQLTAFSFNSNKFYSVKLDLLNIINGAYSFSVTDFFMIENKLYVVFDYFLKTERYSCSSIIHIVEDRTREKSLSHGIDTAFSDGPFFVTGCGDFLYRFIDYELGNVNIARRKLGSQVWKKVGKLDMNGKISRVFCFQDIILVYVSENNKSQSTTHFFYFDTTSRITRFVTTRSVDVTTLSTFLVGDKMYILQENGELWEVVRGVSVEIVLRENIEKFSLNIFGIVVHNNTLFVFCDLQAALQPLPTVCSLGAIKYVHHFNVNKKCQYMRVPKSWLTDEI